MAHYLTFVSPVTCKVNGVSVESGYELHDGDVIVATTAELGMKFLVNDDGTKSKVYSNGDTLDVSDTDVVVSWVN